MYLVPARSVRENCICAHVVSPHQRHIFCPTPATLQPFILNVLRAPVCQIIHCSWCWKWHNICAVHAMPILIKRRARTQSFRCMPTRERFHRILDIPSGTSWSRWETLTIVVLVTQLLTAAADRGNSGRSFTPNSRALSTGGETTRRKKGASSTRHRACPV